MSYQTEFNWVLKLKPGQGLNEGSLVVEGEYIFSKKGFRVYPVNVPIELVNDIWEAVGKVVVLSFTNVDGKTSGKYKVLEAYSGPKKEMLTSHWRKHL